MALTIGTQLGSHEITALLGKGGMGEVYRARDLKLKREVAIKILPDEFSRDDDRLRRFQREAEVLASLNHPNIAAIYDLQEANETRFLVLELVEGETLAERIQRGPIPVEEALEIGSRICEALEAAHEKGIIHRDLKPANVKIDPDGNVKVLDFGLAKAIESNPGNAALSNSPTLVNSFAATNAGVIIGTAAYMSPEQARGFAADQRGDIFAFGCALYEMLTGQQAFQGETVSDILASILAREPDLTRLPANLSPRLIELIRHCLEKNRKRRWHCATDLRSELEVIAAAPKALPVTEQVAEPVPFWRRSIRLVVIAILIGAVAFVAWDLRPSASLAVTRFQIPIPEGQSLFTVVNEMDISPDGAQIVYSGGKRLYSRSMSDLTIRAIPGTETDGAEYGPVFSPDGQWIVFADYRSGAAIEIKKIAVNGGGPVTLYRGAPVGLQWTQRGIVFGEYRTNRILQLSPNGGSPQVLATFKDASIVSDAQLLPDGTAVLATLFSADDLDLGKGRIVLQSLKSGERKVLIEGAATARYVPTGQIVYAVDGTLYAVPFDLKRAQVTGAPIPVIEGVLRDDAAAHFAFANTGTLIYRPGPATGAPQQTIALVGNDGSVKPLGLMPGSYGFPRISPDGKRIAFERVTGKDVAVWVYDLSGVISARQLTLTGTNRYPIWSADGERIAFQSDREGDKGIFWQRADGTGTAERLTKPDKGIEHIPDSWSPDGQKVSFTASGQGESSVWVFSLQNKEALPFAQASSYLISRSVFSPDGKWLAYQSNETKTNEIFVQPFPATGTKYQVSRGGEDAHHPLWSPDGKELYYVPGPAQFVKISITTAPAFSFGNPVPLPSPLILGGPQNARRYDITPDGKQLIGLVATGQTQTGTPAQQQIYVVLNWFTELQQRVPVK
jgi:serine/threonine-protein kinase